MILKSVLSMRDRFKNEPLAIYGAGPGFDLFPKPPEGCNIFALNHTITELFQYEKTIWVSNDHDRTWSNSKIRKGVLSRIENYSPWVTITQKRFIPGPVGDLHCFNHRGEMEAPLKWRLPLPEGSTVYFYNSCHGNEHLGDFLETGETILELALDIATIWGFKPIVLIGADLNFGPAGEYYSGRFSWKPEPPKMRQGKIEKARASVFRKRARWGDDVFIVSELWNKKCPFKRVHSTLAKIILQC